MRLMSSTAGNENLSLRLVHSLLRIGFYAVEVSVCSAYWLTFLKYYEFLLLMILNGRLYDIC